MMNIIFLTFFFFLTLCSCSSYLSFFMPTVRDEKVERFVTEEASTILRVSENAHKAGRYRFHLVRFPREDILGISLGNHQIFISYELSRLAYAQENYRWLLRHTLAHEIAHDVFRQGGGSHEPSFNALPRSGDHVTAQALGLPQVISFRNYSRTAELAADRKAIEYGQRIGWDCRIWINMFRNFLDAGYIGDSYHPTDERLTQAISMCNAHTP